ncbi:MAG TPA: hypothetical protein VJ997_07130 [Longimicrobiales bacterium]|nr:hypothetical protein [Longimicrobiales bacterium]
MTSLPRARRRFASCPGLVLGLLLGMGWLVGSPEHGAAQTAEQLVVQRRLELQAARDAFEAARSAFNVVERQFSSALEEVTRARRQGNKDDLERAYALAQDRSVPYRDRERRLAEAGDALVQARQALVDVLEIRLEQLVEEMDAASSSQRRGQLDLIWRDLSTELQQLEDEAGDTFRLDPVVLPEVASDPRDTPDDILAKADLLERQAAVADTLIQEKEREIQALTSRLRRERQRRDLLAGTDRFDDTRVPVVTGSPTGQPTPSSDSTVAGQRPITLEERIQMLRDYVEQLESYRDQLVIRAQVFRQRIRSVAT